MCAKLSKTDDIYFRPCQVRIRKICALACSQDLGCSCDDCEDCCGHRKFHSAMRPVRGSAGKIESTASAHVLKGKPADQYLTKVVIR